MCNLYDAGKPDRHHVPAIFDQILAELLEQLPKAYGIRKTDPGAVIRRSEEGDWEGETMRWGFDRPHINKSINNAREDKLGGRLWNKAWRDKRRCLIPISTFYEWTGPKGQKQTHAIQAEDPEQLLWAGGLWEQSSAHGFCYTMITTAANEAMESIHDRMPALLSEDAFDDFLNHEDPIALVQDPKPPLRIFPCLNPLTTQQYAVPMETQQTLF